MSVLDIRLFGVNQSAEITPVCSELLRGDTPGGFQDSRCTFDVRSPSQAGGGR
jgi:hypothetical protein